MARAGRRRGKTLDPTVISYSGDTFLQKAPSPQGKHRTLEELLLSKQTSKLKAAAEGS